MDVAPYMSRILHNPGTHVRVLVNDLPMYDRAVMDNVAPTAPATPWFIPGENSLRIEVTEAPRNPNSKEAMPMFELLFYGVDDDNLENETKLTFVRYPDFKEGTGQIDFPYVHQSTFTPQGNVPDPIWADAPPERIPDEGTPELWKAVADLHFAFSKRDVDAFVSAASLKLEDQQRYFGPLPMLTKNEAMKEGAAMFREDWDLAPFDAKELRFRSCAGGRVAYATRKDGGPALIAKHKSLPQMWKVKPLLVRQGADWRVFR